MRTGDNIELAIDGSDLHNPTNPKDTDSYLKKINEQRPYNLLHLNALYDVCGKIYTDTIIQKSHLNLFFCYKVR